MKNQEWAGKLVQSDAKFVLDMTETVSLLFKSAIRYKKWKGLWYKCIPFRYEADAKALIALGWTWRVLWEDSEAVWIVNEDDEGVDFKDMEQQYLQG